MHPRQSGDRLPQLGVAVLAAGLSSRMGRSKPMLPWGAGTIVEHHLALWSALGAKQIAVVLRPDDTPLEDELCRVALPGTARIYNDAPEQGMMESVRLAARWAGWMDALSHWAIVLADQPHIRHETLAALLRHAGDFPEMICQPAAGATRGHPVVLPRHAWMQLAESDDSTLRDFLHRHEAIRSFMLCRDPAVVDDLDTPEAYRAAAQPPLETTIR